MDFIVHREDAHKESHNYNIKMRIGGMRLKSLVLINK